VVLVVIDGARWQDVFEREGAAPNLRRLAETRGAALGAPGHGEPVSASGPSFVSLPGYTEIFTGRPPSACASNDCDPPGVPTFVDELVARAPAPGDVAIFSSWAKIPRAASSVGAALPVVSAGRDRVEREDVLHEDATLAKLLANGKRADAFPGDDDFRPDRFTAAAALRYLEARRPRFLFLGLGETDEYAHRGDHPAYVASLRAADRVVGDVMAALDRMGEAGAETTLFVTADHGRAKDWRHHGGGLPESARVWLVAAGARIAARGFVSATEPRHLADLAPTVRALFELPADPSKEAGSVLRELLDGAGQR
jgi:hypothetical protein